MLQFLAQKKQFLLLILVWLFSGIYLGPAVYIIIPASLLFLKKKELYLELFLGFFFILVLSDSRQHALQFAANAKNLYIVLLGLFVFFDQKSFAPFDKVYQFFIPFLLIALICLLNSPIAFVSFQKLTSYFLIFLIVPNYLIKLYRLHRGEVFKYFIHFTTLLLISGLILRFLKPDVVMLEGRYCGVLGNPNGLGILTLLIFIIYTVVDEYFPQLFEKNEKRLFLGVLFVSVLMTGSRGGLFSILLFLLFKYFYKMSPFLGFIILIFVIISYEYIYMNLPTIIQGLDLEEYFRLETLQSGSGRVIAWDFAWENIQDNIFIGKGFAFTEFLFKKNYLMLSQMGHQGNAHNSFLTFWLDTGLIGLFAYIAGLLAVFIRAAKNSRLAFPVLFTVFFSAYVESWLTASLNPFTILFLIVITVIFSPVFNLTTQTQENSEKSIVPLH